MIVLTLKVRTLHADNTQAASLYYFIREAIKLREVETMKLSGWVSKSAIALAAAVAAPTVFASSAAAGPGLYFSYAYISKSTSECVNEGNRALRSRSLQTPSNTTGDTSVFAIGEGDVVTVVVDCSEILNSGRVTVMATSNDPAIADRYSQGVLADLTR